MDQKKQRIAIVIDGNNFYKGLEPIEGFNGAIDLFDFNGFAEFICGKQEITAKRFYKGVIRKEEGNLKSQKMVSNQQKLFSKLENCGWKVVRGRMSKNTEFGKCEGFYFLDDSQKINSKQELECVAKEILEKHNLAYKPIIIVSSYSKDIFTMEKSNCELGKLNKQNSLHFAMNTWKEKGVDVNIAIDMLSLAYSGMGQKNLDQIILVSNDSDLKPVIERVQGIGMPVKYVGFENKYSISLLNSAQRRFLLTEEQLKQFFPQTLPL